MKARHTPPIRAKGTNQLQVHSFSNRVYINLFYGLFLSIQKAPGLGRYV
jgi:hypothetical protein